MGENLISEKCSSIELFKNFNHSRIWSLVLQMQFDAKYSVQWSLPRI